jgi:hypothetical protein
MVSTARRRDVLTLVNAMRQNPEAGPHMAAAAALASFDPILCELVESVGVDTQT